jgi:hypothetical protein
MKAYLFIYLLCQNGVIVDTEYLFICIRGTPSLLVYKAHTYNKIQTL